MSALKRFGLLLYEYDGNEIHKIATQGEAKAVATMKKKITKRKISLWAEKTSKNFFWDFSGLL